MMTAQNQFEVDNCSLDGEAIKQIGIVEKVEADQALIRVKVMSACANCHAPCVIAGEMKDRHFWVKRSDLKVNQVVELAIKNQLITKGSAFLYLLPAVLIIIFASIGYWLFMAFNVASSDFGVMLGIVVSLPIIVWILHKYHKRVGGIEVISVTVRGDQE